MLTMMYHPYSSQKNEAINQAIATVAPKNKTFCKTMSLTDRINLVIIIDSVRYEVGIARIISALSGCTNAPMVILKTWLKRRDSKKNWIREHAKKRSVKQKHARKQRNKIRAQTAQELKGRRTGGYYGTGIAIADVDTGAGIIVAAEGDGGDGGGKPPAKRQKTTTTKTTTTTVTRTTTSTVETSSEGGGGDRPKRCSSCGRTDHQRRSSRLCPNYKPSNKSNKKRKQSKDDE